MIGMLAFDDIAERNPRMRSFLVSVNGENVTERYFGTATPEEYANVYSVTKSVLSLLVGIALGTGEIKSLNQSMENSWVTTCSSRLKLPAESPSGNCSA